MKKKTPRKARKARKSPARRRPAHRKAARKSNPTRKRAHAKKRAKRSVKRTARGRHLVPETDKFQQVPNRRRAKRKSNPARRRRSSARRRPRASARRRPHARRRSNPARKHHKKARRSYGRRRSNPTGGTKMHQSGAMDMVLIGLSVVGGLVLGNVIDRFVATRAGESTTAFHNANASTQISAPPDAMRLGAQGAGAVVAVLAGYYAAKKGYKKTAEVLCGMGIGIGAGAVLQVVNDKVLPSVVTATTANEITWKTRLFPDLQKANIDAMTTAATAARTALKNSAAGVPRSMQAPARGPQPGARQVPPPPAQRPAPSTVGCGLDAGLMAKITSLQSEIDRLKASNTSNGASVTDITPQKKKNAFA